MDKIKSYAELIERIESEKWGVIHNNPNIHSFNIKIKVNNDEFDRRIYQDGKEEWTLGDNPWAMFPKSEYPDDYSDKMDALLKDVDYTAIFRTMYQRSMSILADKLPVVSNFIASCDMQEDKTAGTLYATYDELLGDFSIHYNPEFVVQMAISDCVANDINPKEILDSTFAFLVAHEAFHILKYHIYNQTGATTDIDHDLANVLEDSFINTQLLNVFSFGNRTLSMGIANDLEFSGVFNKIYTNMNSILDDLAQVFGVKLSREAKTDRVYKIPEGTQGSIRLYYSNDILERLFKGNSNMFVRSLSLISTKIIQKPKVNTNNLMDAIKDLMNQLNQGSGGDAEGSQMSSSGSSSSGGNSSSGSGNSSSQSGGDSSGGDSGDRSGDSSNSSSSSDGSSSGGNGSAGGGDNPASSGDNNSNVSSPNSPPGESGGASKPNSGPAQVNRQTSSDIMKAIAEAISQGDNNQSVSDEQMGQTPAATQKAKEKLNDAVKDSNDDSDDSTLSTQSERRASLNRQENKNKESKMMDGLGISKGVLNTSTAGSWKSALTKILSDCMGSAESYNPNLPSARVVGQLGRDEDVTAPKSICLLIDKSGSMSVDKFKEALNEVEMFVKTSRMRSVKAHLIFWGSSAKYYKLPSTKDLVKNIKAREENLGGTNLNYGLDIAKQRCKRCDAYLCFTDGEIYNYMSDENKIFFRRIRKRFVWVLTKTDYSKSWIVKNDPGCKQRIIIPK